MSPKKIIQEMKKEFNATVKAASVTQSAAPELGIEEKTLHYVVIEVGEELIRINTGEKTVNKIKEMTKKKTNELENKQPVR